MELFKELTEEEEYEYRLWARDNWPFREGMCWNDEPKNAWHPVVQEECKRMNNEFKLGLRLRIQGLSPAQVEREIKELRDTYGVL